MQAALAPRGDARTYLTHFVGDGLQDDRYVAETFRSLANGEIVPVQAEGTPKGRRKARGRILALKVVEKLRPARDEIIIATGLKLRNAALADADISLLNAASRCSPRRRRRLGFHTPPTRRCLTTIDRLPIARAVGVVSDATAA